MIKIIFRRDLQIQFSLSGKNYNRIVKIVCSISFFSLFIALINAHLTPAVKYETSIYSGMGVPFWIIFGISSIIGIAIISFNKLNNKLKLGFVIVVFNNIVLLSLPLIRHYFFWNFTGDSGVHLGFAKDLLNEGYISEDNFYPFTIIYIDIISNLLGISLDYPFKIILLVFYLLFFIFSFYFYKTFLCNKERVGLGYLSGLVITNVFYSFLCPNAFGNCILPLAFYVYISRLKKHNPSWNLLLVIMIIILPIIHPLPSFIFLLFIAITAALSVPHILFPIQDYLLFGGFLSKPRIANHKRLAMVFLFLFISLVAWLSSFFIWDATISNLYTVATEGGQTYASMVLDQANYAQTHEYNLILYFLKVYGNIFIYILILALLFFVFLSDLAKKRRLPRDAILYIPISSVLLFLAMLYLMKLPFGPIRLLAYVIFLCAPLIGYALSRLINRSEENDRQLSKGITVLVIIFFIMIYFNGASSLYPSPYTHSINMQYTMSELCGMEWFVKNKDHSVFSCGWYYDPRKESFSFLSPKERLNRTDLYPQVTEAFPDHFGYDKYSYLGENFRNDIYLILRSLNYKIYTEVFPEMAKYRLTLEDFSKMENDSTIHKIYLNGGFEVRYIIAHTY